MAVGMNINARDRIDSILWELLYRSRNEQRPADNKCSSSIYICPSHDRGCNKIIDNAMTAADRHRWITAATLYGIHVV